MSAFGTKRTYALQQKLIAQDHCGASAKALISAPTVMIVRRAFDQSDVLVVRVHNLMPNQLNLIHQIDVVRHEAGVP